MSILQNCIISFTGIHCDLKVSFRNLLIFYSWSLAWVGHVTKHTRGRPNQNKNNSPECKTKTVVDRRPRISFLLNTIDKVKNVKKRAHPRGQSRRAAMGRAT